VPLYPSQCAEAQRGSRGEVSGNAGCVTNGQGTSNSGKWKEQMTSGGRNFLDIPTAKVLWTAFIAIVVFMALGGLLYHLADKGPKDYVAKIGDCFIQGALISILFAILQAMIDKRDWRQVFRLSSNKT
jgi:hypothetical protein